MVKTGVVDGTVKTAEADNKGDPIGIAAKCMADAKKAVSELTKASGFVKKKEEPKK